jgi:hypothetical protein
MEHTANIIMLYDYALFISMMSFLCFSNCMFFSSLKINLLLLFSSLGKVNIAIVEEQSSDFRKEKLKTVGESCS